MEITAFTDGRFTSFLPPKQSNSDAVQFELAPVTPKSLNFSLVFTTAKQFLTKRILIIYWKV